MTLENDIETITFFTQVDGDIYQKETYPLRKLRGYMAW
jgi:hypothetical protein